MRNALAVAGILLATELLLTAAPCGAGGFAGLARAVSAEPQSPALAAAMLCGDRSGDGKISATDALLVLRAAVGLVSCDPWICDVNASGGVSAADALLILRVAVGLDATLLCPPPPTTTTTSTTSTSTTTTTLFPQGCPFDGPLSDLRMNCLPLVYVYEYKPEALVEGLATDGAEVAIGQTDGIDLILYVGTVSSQTSAALTAASINQSPFVALSRGSVAALRNDGYLLDLTIKISGQTFAFRGATYAETVLVDATESIAALRSVLTAALPERDRPADR